MAKPKAQPSVVNRHIYTRASYLYQAANYLAQAKVVSQPQEEQQKGTSEHVAITDSATAVVKDASGARAARNLSRRMVSDIRSMSLKAQVRHSPAMKSTMCKSCNSLLVEGQTSRTGVENASRGGAKPWADVLTVQCLVCQHVKRYPVGAKRQKRRHQRAQAAADTEHQNEDDPTPT